MIKPFIVGEMVTNWHLNETLVLVDTSAQARQQKLTKGSEVEEHTVERAVTIATPSIEDAERNEDILLVRV